MPRPFPFPEFAPVNLTGITSREILEVQIELALNSYKCHLHDVRRRQTEWAERMLPFLNDVADTENRHLAQRRLASNEHWTRYTIPGNTDSILAIALYTYGSKSRIDEHL